MARPGRLEPLGTGSSPSPKCWRGPHSTSRSTPANSSPSARSAEAVAWSSTAGSSPVTWWSWRLPVSECSATPSPERSEEHTSELQSRLHLVCRLLLEKKKIPPSYKQTLPAGERPHQTESKRLAPLY